MSSNWTITSRKCNPPHKKKRTKKPKTKLNKKQNKTKNKTKQKSIPPQKKQKKKKGKKQIKKPNNICYAKDEGAVDHSTVNRWFKKFRPNCKNIDGQTKSDSPKSFCKLKRQNRRVENGESQACSASHSLMLFSKSIQSCWIVPHITKILQNFWFTRVKSLTKV